MNNDIGLKLSAQQANASTISILRKHSSLSIGEIKEKITSSSYIISCDATDPNGVENIIKCYSALNSSGIEASLFEHERPASIQLIKNLSNMHKTISDQVDADINDSEGE